MSRFPNPLNRVALNPIATPVNRYIIPSVRRQNGGVALGQLAQALSTFNNKLEDVANRQLSAHADASQRAARADYVNKFRFKNQQELKAAADDGKIQYQDNPWYMVALRQETARQEVADVHASLIDAYSQDAELQQQDGVEGVEKFADERLQPLLQGRDSYELDAMQPEIERARQDIVTKHVENRSNLRVQQRAISVNREAQNLVQSVRQGTGHAYYDPTSPEYVQAQQIVTTTQSQMQAWLAEKKKTLPWWQAEQSLVEAVANQMVTEKDDRLGYALLSGIHSEGDDRKPLADAYASTLKQAEDRVSDWQRKEIEWGAREEELTDQKNIREVKGKWNDLYSKAVKANGGKYVDPSTVVIPLDSVPADVRDDFIGWRNQMFKMIRDGHDSLIEPQVRKVMEDAMTPGFDEQKYRVAGIPISQWLAKNGRTDELMRLQSVWDRQRNNRWAVTDPEAVLRLRNLFKEYQINPNESVDLLDEVRKELPHLDQSDFRSLSKEAQDMMSDPHKRDFLTSVDDAKLQTMVAYGHLDALNQPENSADFHRDLVKAQVGMQAAWDRFLREHPNASAQERSTMKAKLMDDMALASNGRSWEEVMRINPDDPHSFDRIAYRVPPTTAVSLPSHDTTTPATSSTSSTSSASPAPTPAAPSTTGPKPGTPSQTTPTDVQSNSLTTPDSHTSPTTPAKPDEFRNTELAPLDQTFHPELMKRAESALAAYREKMPNTVFDRSYLPYDFRPADTYPTANQQGDTWGGDVTKRLNDLKTWVTPQYVQTFIDKVNAVTNAGQMTGKQKLEIINMAYNIRELAWMRAIYGWSADEVKQLGSDAWKHYPMTDNLTNLQDQQWVKTQTERLGIDKDPKRVAEFIRSQMALLGHRPDYANIRESYNQ